MAAVIDEDRIAKLEAQVIRLKKRIASCEKQCLDLMTDMVTGLYSARMFYVALHNVMKRQTHDHLTHFSRASKEALPGSLEILANIPVKTYVMAGDIAYLGWINQRAGHSGGDIMLRRIADAAREMGSPPPTLKVNKILSSPFLGFRYTTGDEMAFLLQASTFQEALEKGRLFQAKVNQLTGIPIMDQFGIHPHVDVGISQFQEAVRAFPKVLVRGIPVSPRRRRKVLVQLWYEIADRRSFLDKGLSRIKFLMNTREKTPEFYQAVISSFRKGAEDISDHDLDDLIMVRSLDGPWKEEIVRFLRRKAERKLADFVESFRAVKEAAWEIADPIIIEEFLRKN